MKHFIFTTKKGPNGKDGYYMYISFDQEPLKGTPKIECSGAALIIPDGKTEIWLDYIFAFSPDWEKFSNIGLKPSENKNEVSIKFTADELTDFVSDIVTHIKTNRFTAAIVSDGTIS